MKAMEYLIAVCMLKIVLGLVLILVAKVNTNTFSNVGGVLFMAGIVEVAGLGIFGVKD